MKGIFDLISYHFVIENRSEKKLDTNGYTDFN